MLPFAALMLATAALILAIGSLLAIRRALREGQDAQSALEARVLLLESRSTSLDETTHGPERGGTRRRDEALVIRAPVLIAVPELPPRGQAQRTRSALTGSMDPPSGGHLDRGQDR